MIDSAAPVMVPFFYAEAKVWRNQYLKGYRQCNY